MFFKKQKQEVMSSEQIEKMNANITLDKGIKGVKDLFAPSSFDRSSHYHMRVNQYYARSFVMEGFPATVSVGWLDRIYNYDGDMDTILHISPVDEREVLDELTAKITQFEAQRMTEEKRNSIKNSTRLMNKIQELYELRAQIEQNVESMFQIQIASTLYTKNELDMNKETAKLENQLKGRKIMLNPTYLRQDDGYKTVLPIGKSYLPDKFRNFSSGALTSTFPFYNSEISHERGVLVGINIQTETPIVLDFYNRSLLNNSNINVFGRAGSGKTYFVSLLTIRSSLTGIRTVIIDPEGEYKKVTDAMNGSFIEISPDSKVRLNPFDLEEEEDDNGVVIVNLKEKIADVLNLIGVMSGGLQPDELSVVSAILAELYESFGFTEDPASLYEQSPSLEDDLFVFDGKKKRMPTFSDFHNLLDAYTQTADGREYAKLTKTLSIFKKGGIYDLFDGQTSESISDFMSAPVVTFDVSSLEENILRPIGMYIALSWAWEKFGKKNPMIRKRIIVDEAWMLVNKNMKGHEYTAQFLENSARRIRKRNGGLLVASQNFIEFEESPQGKAVLTNSTANIFLQQSSNDIDHLQTTFKLSMGETNFLMSAERGEMLIRLKDESVISYALAFDYEHDLITDPYGVLARQAAMKQRNA